MASEAVEVKYSEVSEKRAKLNDLKQPQRSQRLPRFNFMDLYNGQMEVQTIVEKVSKAENKVKEKTD